MPTLLLQQNVTPTGGIIGSMAAIASIPSIHRLANSSSRGGALTVSDQSIQQQFKEFQEFQVFK